ncbi:transcription factor bHLH [Forsythia ovata]|uniref:Transcription factor bHLH n=1 Tax=Forsythia ovata TaxID=205694 RepID=A0ABD1QQS8_9LAMI
MNNSSSFLFSNDNTALKHVSRDMMALDFFQNQQNCGGLARFRSTPSSFLATLSDSGNENNSCDEASETIYSNLMNQSGAMKQEIDVSMEQHNGFSNGSYLGMDNVSMNCGNGNGINHSNLVRQSSSPAGFFNGFGVMGEVGSYRISNHAEANSPTNGLKNHVNFSSGSTSSSRFMPRIPENGNEDIGTSSPENGNGDNSTEYDTTLLKDSWNDSPFNSLKRNRDGDLKTFSNFNGLIGNENGETRNSATAV